MNTNANPYVIAPQCTCTNKSPSDNYISTPFYESHAILFSGYALSSHIDKLSHCIYSITWPKHPLYCDLSRDNYFFPFSSVYYALSFNVIFFRILSHSGWILFPSRCLLKLIT